MTNWNAANPANGSSASSDLRNNFDAIEHSLLGMNLLADPELRIWAAGTAAVPTYFFTAGTAPTITQCGIGLGDTTRKYGPFSIKAVGGGATGYIGQIIIPATADTYYGWDSYFTDAEFTAGAYVKSADLNACRIGIGETTTSLDAGDYHTGSNAWEWITGPKHTVGSATVVAWMAEIGAGKTAYISGPTATFGGITPMGPLPCQAVYEEQLFRVASTFVVGANRFISHPFSPALIKHAITYALNGPTGADIIMDVKTWDGSSAISVFTTKPKIVAGSLYGIATPDGLYSARCLNKFSGTYNAGTYININIDQVGSGTPGSDGYLSLGLMKYVRAFEALHAYNT